MALLKRCVKPIFSAARTFTQVPCVSKKGVLETFNYKTLLDAVLTKNIPHVASLLQKEPALIHQVDQAGNSALHHACLNIGVQSYFFQTYHPQLTSYTKIINQPSTALIALLLANGANPVLCNKKIQTPLSIAQTQTTLTLVHWPEGVECIRTKKVPAELQECVRLLSLHS